MASPQTEDGFAMIANELLAAIFIADFPKYEKVVLADVLLSIYGPRKHRAATLDHIRLADMIGVDPRMIRRAVKNLALRGVIRELPDGTYSFVKDWESWVNPRDSSRQSDPLCRLIGAGERRFVAHSVARFAEVVPSRHKRKEGTKQSPRSDFEGTNESPKRPTSGTIQSPTEIDASDGAPGDTKDLGISSSETPVPPDPPLLLREEIQEDKDLGLTAKEERGREAGLPAGLEEEVTPRPRGKAGARKHSPSPVADRLVAWVQSRLEAQEYDADYLAGAEKLCRDCVEAGLNPEWCAQAFQAALDLEGVLDKTPYARGILRRMYTEHRDGVAVLAPAFCDFRATPDAPTMPARHAGRQTMSERIAERDAARTEAIMRHFGPKESSDGLR